MATNNFKPFGTGAGANVTSQTDYEALAALVAGFTAGKASSAQINKALRQGTVMASVLGQFIANAGAVDVLDNGDTATLLTNFLAALKANSAGSFLQTANNFVEIKNVGPVAVSTALANLGLSDVVHAPQLTGVVGEARNAKMSVTAASATATFTADEMIVGTALGGLQYRIGSFSKTINLATTGAGGMDTGTAPVSGYVAIYAIYNPTTATSALLAVNATAAVAPEVYGGANMPAGYTASALVSVWPTNASSLFKIGYQNGRKISFTGTSVVSSTGSGVSNPYSSFSASAAIPKNAKEALVLPSTTNNTNSGGAYVSLSVASDANGSGSSGTAGYSAANIGTAAGFMVSIITAQLLYQSLFSSAGTTTYNVSISAYTF